MENQASNIIDILTNPIASYVNKDNTTTAAAAATSFKIKAAKQRSEPNPENRWKKRKRGKQSN